MATKTPNIVPLKLLVISLGFVLMGGMLFTVGAVVHKVKQAKQGCGDVQVSLAGLHIKGVLGSITAAKDGSIQLVVSEGPNNTVVTLDRCTGMVQQTFKIVP